MEKIIWWWNMVYYFHVRWYEIFGRILMYPFTLLIRSKFMTELYRKRGVENAEKTINDAVKKSGVAEFCMEVVNAILLFLPVFAIVTLFLPTLNRLSLNKELVKMLYIGCVTIPYYLVFKVNEHLLEKKNRYKRLFREFDAMFKNDVWKRRRYGTLVFLTDLFLISITVIIIYCGNVIRHS
ncbi:MAG: hypothetical protein MJZ13_07770 [Bacteroidales bacterium]|nr:hypothetical protein [Bacteroidales bacterium]